MPFVRRVADADKAADGKNIGDKCNRHISPKEVIDKECEAEADHKARVAPRVDQNGVYQRQPGNPVEPTGAAFGAWRGQHNLRPVDLGAAIYGKRVGLHTIYRHACPMAKGGGWVGVGWGFA